MWTGRSFYDRMDAGGLKGFRLAPLDEIVLNRLGSGFETAFARLAEDIRADRVDDPAVYWAEFTALALNRLILREPPAIERNVAVLPFHDKHEIRTELFSVMSGGGKGGPTVDVLLQVWYETESLSAAFGIPLIMRTVPSFGAIPQALWSELREIAAKLNPTTPAGRIVLIGIPDMFEGQGYSSPEPVVALPATMVAGMTKPPYPSRARGLTHFAYDLASGWIGDPALSGRGQSPMLNEFLGFFDVAHLLRVRIERVAPDTTPNDIRRRR
jgi:hypothetical protein